MSKGELMLYGGMVCIAVAVLYGLLLIVLFFVRKSKEEKVNVVEQAKNKEIVDEFTTVISENIDMRSEEKTVIQTQQIDKRTVIQGSAIKVENTVLMDETELIDTTELLVDKTQLLDTEILRTELLDENES